MNLAEKLASYAKELEYADLDDETVETAKKRIIDSLGCGFAAMGDEKVENILNYSRKKGGKTRIIGGGKSSLEGASLANGTLVRYLDWNDTYLSKEPGHPSDNLGAMLSVADSENCSGKELILSLVLAYEIQCRLCDAASLRVNGFDHVNYGLISSALGAGKMMDLSEEELTQAVNISINGHVALRQARSGRLSEWKGIAFANASRNAVFAAELARGNVQGPAPIFEGEFGFFNQLTGEFSLDFDNFGGREGNFKINETYIKYYPVEYHAQAAVNCSLSILNENNIDPENIEKIHNETYEAGVSIIAGDEEKWRPETRETADHSMPYCIARSFLDNEMTLEQFEEEKYMDKKVRKLMDKIEVEENKEYTKRYGESFPHRMVVKTSDSRYEMELEYPKGHPNNPLSKEEIEDKFKTASEGELSDEEMDKILNWGWSLDNKKNIGEIFEI